MRKILLASLLATSLLAGCGGNDPLNVFADPADVPTIQLPVVSTAVSNVNPYSTNTPSFTFLLQSGTFTAFAPAKGLIRAIEIGTSGYALTIVYSSQFIFKVSQLLSTNRRVGDFVQAGDDIGAVAADGIHTPQVQILQNGASICPYSFFDSNARQIINGHLSQPCS